MAVIELIMVFLCVAGAAYFAAVETAVIASNVFRVSALANRGDRRAALVGSFLERPERFLGAVVLAGNMCVIGGSAVATVFVSRYFAPVWAVAVSTVFMTALVVVFAEVLPKSVSLQNPDFFALATARGVGVVIYLLTPVTYAFTTAVKIVLRAVGLRRRGRSPYVSREELRSLLTEKRGDAPTVLLEKQMIRRIFRFGETKVAQVMVPLVDVVSASEKATVAEAVALIREHGYSRLPVYRERIDDIRGVIYAPDLLGVSGGEPVDRFIRPVAFYPETKSIETALSKLRASELKMAMVVDEYGGVTGLVTLEDIAEEVAGEIEDEYDSARPKIVRTGDYFELAGEVEIDYLNEHLPVPLPKEGYETVAGFVITKLERIPAVGEELEWPPYAFKIMAASDRSVERLRLYVKGPGSKPEGT